MSKFLLKSSSLKEGHHKKCQEKCDKTDGDMLRCMNLNAVGQKPCTNVIHAQCSGYDPELVQYFTHFYCVECITGDDNINKAMTASEEAAAEQLAASRVAETATLKEDYSELQEVATKLEAELNTKVQVVTEQANEIERLKKLVAELQTKPTVPEMSQRPALINRLNDTLRRAEGVRVNNTNNRVNQSVNAGNRSIFNTTIFNSGMPDYDEQERSASQQDEHSLLLVRTTLAKPIPFDGDVTKWATFMSEFVRTSKRGHYRDFEDMDRLRELIIGEAREMFTTELSDPCAEALPTLERLDEFFGVKGNAVRVALDRISQLPKIEKTNDKQKLKQLYTSAKQFVLQCKIHGQEHELSSQSSILILEGKMQQEHVKNWRQWAKTNDKSDDVDGLIAFLEDTIRDLSFRTIKNKPSISANVNATEVTGGLDEGGTEAAQSTSTSSKSPKPRDKPRKEPRKTKTKKQNRYADCECFQCREKHPFYVCPQLIAANDTKRMEIVNRLHVCTRCLCSNKHKVEECHNKCLRCYISGCTVKNKHPLLHGHSNEQIPSFTSTIAHIDTRFLQAVSHFAMVPGEVVASDGTRIATNIMFDTGSGVSLATSDLFRQAKLDSHMEYELTLRWATDVTHTDSNAKLCDIKFIPQGRNKAIVLKNITAVDELKLPEQEQDAKRLKQQFPYLTDVPIPSYAKQVPQIMLGLTHAALITPIKTVTGERQESPVAALTPLGWAIYGSCFDSCNRTARKPLVLGFASSRATDEATNEELIRLIKASTEIDNIGIAHKDASRLSPEDQYAQRIIDNTMKFIPSAGRYEIGLLWKKPDDTMPDNYDQAVQRLISTEKRLKKLGMLEFVQKQFEEQIQSGWLVETTREEAEKHPRRNYVYGFLTFNKNKTPPKPRWVNDTASKYKGVSLNSKLLKGPDTLVPLPQSMCSLREGRIAYQGDVKSMFNQVLLKEEDQYSQLTLWRDGDETKEPRIYRQTRVIFGPACSPADTSSIRIDHAEKSKDEFPDASDVAIHQMYVDDAPDSRDSVEEASKVANDLITLFARIGWPLVQFQSNSKEFLDQIPQEAVSQKMTEVRSDQEELITKVLGLYWKPKEDVYVYRLADDSLINSCNKQYRPSKREMLSTIMRIFDPLGLISPFRIRGQMIMQRVWKAGTDWKDKPPQEICNAFTEWLNDFSQVARLEIPRPYSSQSLKDASLSLHVFVDAGTEAYAACAYIRIEHSDQVSVRLVAAKARVAPIKYTTIPRLELMSGLIGARLFTAVKQWHRRLNFTEYQCWTDSDISLRWIRSEHLPRTAFTAPRIAEIQELTSPDKWKYVPSEMNVADYATKVRDIKYDDANHEWYTGPRFLYEKQDAWPAQPQLKSTIKAMEVTVSVVQTVNGKRENKNNVLKQISPKVRAEWPVLVRVVAKALRFADHLLPQRPHHRRNGHFTRYEIERAENYIIRLVQQEVFKEEYASLQKDQKVKTTSSIFSLSPRMCQSTSLIRATTRLPDNFPLNMRRPPILPNFHEITDAIVRFYHKMNLHVGDGSIIAGIRSRCWIINAKRAVRRCRARCVHCIKKRVKPATPDRADLPEFRLDIHHKPFFHTGCDLFGPLNILVGRSKHQKKEIHVVIFTCMVTRAVYFEVLDDKSTPNFLTAFDKLWARRGPISHMYSDNGLNFVGAARAIETDELQKATADRKVTWHFNPPYAPNFGGAWERLIKDVKRGLESSIGKFAVPRLQMEAALAQIEANLNNRPLTEVPVQSMEEVPITPYILMTGYPNYPGLDDGSKPELTHPPDIMNLRPVHRINALVQAFRHRFLQEYAPIITRRPLNTAKAKYLIKENDYVFYIDSTKNPSEWPRGVITKVYRGKDFAIRVADIKLLSGQILERRPAHLIAKIDIRLEDPESEQARYEANCNLLVARNSNPPPRKPCDSQATAKQANLDNKMISESVNIKKIQATEYTGGAEPNRRDNIQLTEEEAREYIDKTGKKIIFAKNFPPNIGAGDVYSAMSEFGNVKLIASSSYNGEMPFTCFVGYEDEASVSTALLWDESQLIVKGETAYRQKFERLKKPFQLSRSIYRAIYNLVDMNCPLDVTSRVLVVSTGRESAIHKVLPLNGTGCYINYCPRTQRYNFEQLDLPNGNPETIMDIKFQAKKSEVTTSSSSNEARQAAINQPSRDQPTTSSHESKDRREEATNIVRRVNMASGSIRITAIEREEPAVERREARAPDLREILSLQREGRAIQQRRNELRSQILKPYRSGKSQSGGHRHGGTM